MTFSDDPQIVALSEELYRGVDWRWMLGDKVSGLVVSGIGRFVDGG